MAAEARGLLGRIIQSTRTLTAELAPPILYELGLEAALEWLAEQTESRHGLPVSFADDGLVKPVAEEVRFLMFRSVRELLVNVIKHAGARRAAVSVEKKGTQILIAVADDGAGFDPARQLPIMTGGMGLFNLREGLKNLGGGMEIDSVPGRGTRVTLRAPLAGEGSGKGGGDEHPGSSG